MDDRSTVIAAAIVTIGSLIVAWFTKRSAKDDRAITGYVSLTTSLQAQVNMLWQQVGELQNNEAKRQRLNRAHEPWDDAALKHVPPDFPPPPPLDIWD